MIKPSGPVAQLVRAPRLHRGCREFESLRAHFEKLSTACAVYQTEESTGFFRSGLTHLFLRNRLPSGAISRERPQDLRGAHFEKLSTASAVYQTEESTGFFRSILTSLNIDDVNEGVDETFKGR